MCALTMQNYRDVNDLLRSPIVSHVPPQIVIYCITCALCNKLYIGETGRRLGDRFREHLRDVEKNDKDASKPVARHFNLPNHSKKHMAICGLSLHLATTESRKNLEQKFTMIFQIGTLNPHGINERFSFNPPTQHHCFFRNYPLHFTNPCTVVNLSFCVEENE